MEVLFTIISFVLIMSAIIFIGSLIFLIFSKSESNKKLATKLIIYSTIAFVIGFGTCFGALMLGN
jgi:hypothetical protein